MSERAVRIGLVGAGIFVAMSHAPAIRACTRAALKAICRRDKARLLAAQAAFGSEEVYTDWREMIGKADLDAVVVCTPHDLHAQPTIEALQRGLHVLVEKPMATSGVEARAMADAAEASGRILMVGYNDRFSGLWRTAKQTLESGRIGRVRQVNLAYTAYRRFYWQEKSWPERWWKVGESLQEAARLPAGYFGSHDLSSDWRSDAARNGGGTFANAGAHGANLALWLAGSPTVEVSAMTAPEGQVPEFFVSVMARLASGCHLSLSFGDAAPDGDTMRLTVIGDAGIMAFDSSENAVRVSAGGTSEKIEPLYPDVTPVEALVSSILDGVPNISPAQDAVQSVLLTEAAYRSARGRAPVRIDQPAPLAATQDG